MPDEPHAIRFHPVAAREIVEALRLLEGRRRSRGQHLSAEARQVLRAAELSSVVLSGQTVAPDGADADAPTMAPQLLTVDDVSGQLRTSTTTVRRLISAGELAAVRVGRSVRVRPGDLEAYVAGLGPGAHR